MAGRFEGKGVSDVNNDKVHKLLTMLSKSYYEKRWISMEEIIRYTEMSSFNQRIQTMRKHGLDVKHKTIDDKSHYRMFTDPMTFNWSDYTVRQPQNRIKRTGRVLKKVEKQERLPL